MVFAATSWHWVDPAVRYRRAWELLRPGGHLAFWGASHVFPADGDPFFGEIQDVYDEIGEGLSAGSAFPRPGELPDGRDEIGASGLFGDIKIRHFDWEVSYDGEGYIRLLETFSGHIAMEQWKRDRLYGEIRRRLAAARVPAAATLGRRATCRQAAQFPRRAFERSVVRCHLAALLGVWVCHPYRNQGWVAHPYTRRVLGRPRFTRSHREPQWLMGLFGTGWT